MDASQARHDDRATLVERRPARTEDEQTSPPLRALGGPARHPHARHSGAPLEKRLIRRLVLTPANLNGASPRARRAGASIRGLPRRTASGRVARSAYPSAVCGLSLCASQKRHHALIAPIRAHRASSPTQALDRLRSGPLLRARQNSADLPLSGSPKPEIGSSWPMTGMTAGGRRHPLTWHQACAGKPGGRQCWSRARSRARASRPACARARASRKDNPPPAA